MFAKILGPGTSGYVGLPSPGTVTLSPTHPQQQATWEVIDPLQTGTTSLRSGMQVTIKSTTTSPPVLLEWFTAGGGGIRTTTSIVPTGATKFLIEMPGSPHGTIIPNGSPITLSARPGTGSTGLLGRIRDFFRGLMSVFTGTPPAWYVSASGTTLGLTQLTTPGTPETFNIFHAPVITGFTISPVQVPFERTATATAVLSFLFTIPPGGGTVALNAHSGSRFLANLPPQITVPEGVTSHTLQLPLRWGFRSCEKLSIDASTVLPFATRSEVFIADFMDPVPFFSMRVTPKVIEVTTPPSPATGSVDFIYDTTQWPNGSDDLDLILTMSPNVVLGSWRVSRATPTSQPVPFSVTPTQKQDCVAFVVDFKFSNRDGGGGREGIAVLTKQTP